MNGQQAELLAAYCLYVAWLDNRRLRRARL